MVSFGGVRTLQLFDTDTLLMSFGVFKFLAITIGSYCNGQKSDLSLRQFAKQGQKNSISSGMFPLNPEHQHNVRNSEKCIVNFAHTENYKNSAVPYCQRLLNQDHQEQEERQKASVEAQRLRAKQEEKERFRTRKKEERERREEERRREGGL